MASKAQRQLAYLLSEVLENGSRLFPGIECIIKDATYYDKVDVVDLLWSTTYRGQVYFEAIRDYGTSPKVQPYELANSVAYASCITTWIFIVNDLCGRGPAETLGSLIRYNGLFYAIETGEAFASAYLESLKGDSIVLSNGVFFKILNDTVHRLSDEEACKVILQVCRYPKRFCPISRNTGESEIASLEKFSRCGAKCNAINNNWSVWPGPAVHSMATEAMREILIPKRGYRKCICERGSFSNGSIRMRDGRTTSDIGVKYSELVGSSMVRWIGSKEYKTRYYDFLNSSVPYRFGRPPRVVKVMCVPKDFKSKRIIAPTPAIYNWIGHSVREYLLYLTERTGAIVHMDPEDQTVNAQLSKFGSLDGAWDTFDLSSASDSIPRQLMFSMLPMELRDCIAMCLEDYVLLPSSKGDKVFPCSMIATSGNVLTPFLQSVFFLALGRVACSLSGVPCDGVFVYNDDIVVRHAASDCLRDLITLYGGTVNEKKTYCTGPYRESCGSESYNGFDVAPLYWPRSAFPTNGEQAMSFMVTLQHRLESYTLTNIFLMDVVTKSCPRVLGMEMTFSCDVEHSDLYAAWMSPEESEKSQHLVFTNRRAPRGTLDIAADQFGFEAYELDLYTQFLENGPHYESPLDELLHVTTPRRLVDDYFYHREPRWTAAPPLYGINS
jgi:hypothetical protein